jgi:hypothetical protein
VRVVRNEPVIAVSPEPWIHLAGNRCFRGTTQTVNPTISGPCYHGGRSAPDEGITDGGPTGARRHSAAAWRHNFNSYTQHRHCCNPGTSACKYPNINHVTNQGHGLLRHYATSRKVAGSRPDDELYFSNYLTLPSALGPGVYSASNRNEYQKQKNNVSGE